MHWALHNSERVLFGTSFLTWVSSQHWCNTETNGHTPFSFFLWAPSKSWQPCRQVWEPCISHLHSWQHVAMEPWTTTTQMTKCPKMNNHVLLVFATCCSYNKMPCLYHVETPVTNENLLRSTVFFLPSQLQEGSNPRGTYPMHFVQVAVLCHFH